MSEANMLRINSMTQSSSTDGKDEDKKNDVETDIKESNYFDAICNDDNQNIDQFLFGVLEMIDANSEAMCLSDMYIDDVIKNKQY